MNTTRFLRLAALAIASGCSDEAVAPDLPLDQASLAKGGPPSTQKADLTITDASMGLVSDGKGTYRDGICGVVGTWSSSGSHLAPAEGTIPKSQRASCVGVAPRAATVTLAVRHVSDNPHVDDAASPPGSGAYSVGNVNFGFGTAQATTINASGAFCGTLGMRFTSVTYPGTSDVVREDLGGGLWHMYTRPYPDNIGYCANAGVVAYWHVSFDLLVQIR